MVMGSGVAGSRGRRVAGMTLKYDQLDVYKMAFGHAVRLHKISVGWPKYEQYGGMADQLRRASKSICANLAEGLGKAGSTEQARFINIALGSAEEVKVWVSFAAELGYLTPKETQELSEAYGSIARMLFALIERRKKKNS
ncbi:MAG: four helix bundle protein [Proteobacteria bacterium]|nr:four helix bundle protein [Pseudomonadota bacterium]